jgi:RimK family alpha-L-glutamate ligase
LHSAAAPITIRNTPMRFAIVSRRPSATNDRLAAAACRGVAWQLLSPRGALDALVPGDVALGRLDVLPTLDGVDDGLWALGELAACGVRVLNGPSALLAAHDKLLTARLLRRAGLPHPDTRLVRSGGPLPVFDRPVVLKPRFGSWGRHVVRCHDAGAVRDCLRGFAGEPWFEVGGALVQELVPPVGHDLRLVVAGGHVIGAVSRVAAPGEWRTNVALGASRAPVVAPPEACALALAAAAAARADLVGVDLLPTADGGWAVLELNGAVDFSDEYAPGSDVFADASLQLARAALGCASPAIGRVSAGAA